MRFVRCLSTLAALALLAVEPAAARAHSTDPMDWIIQHVCADASDKPTPVDPYGGCPPGTRDRRLNINEPMPYYRYDKGDRGHPLGFQRHDAYPIIDRHYGAVVSANDFDFDYSEPYGVMHPGDGDGYDVYRVANGWVTGGDTRDGSGYSSSFFGANCKPFGGWIFFPVSFLRDLRPGAQGRAMAPIRGSYWEQAGLPWPGRCESGKGFSTSTLTTWSFSPVTSVRRARRTQVQTDRRDRRHSWLGFGRRRRKPRTNLFHRPLWRDPMGDLGRQSRDASECGEKLQRADRDEL